jgi:alpha-pyrone synthase
VAEAYLNAIGCAVPANEVHGIFAGYAPGLLSAPHDRRLFGRMVERSGIERRYSVLAPSHGAGQLDDAGLYREGAFAGTGARMRVFTERAPDLGFRAALDLADDLHGITHLVCVTCTGFSAPGLDLELTRRLALKPSVERMQLGFMGCYAAINALRLARHLVRSEPSARVLVICLELCTLHLQDTPDLEQVLSFLIFADGAAAALVTAEPRGLRLLGGSTAVVSEAADQITWRIGDLGFDMGLSGAVPATIGHCLPEALPELLAGRTENGSSSAPRGSQTENGSSSAPRGSRTENGPCSGPRGSRTESGSSSAPRGSRTESGSCCGPRDSRTGNRSSSAQRGSQPDDIALWAIHPGGRSVLDAVERSLGLGPDDLAWSRDVLRSYGNMSSATVLFVLAAMLRAGARGPGCAMAFGPGLAIESLLFEG